MEKFRYTTSVTALAGDIHTPVTTYLKVRDIFAQSALMESSDYHGGENGRSFIGLEPIAKISVNHGYATAHYPDGCEETTQLNDSTMRIEDAVASFLSRFEIEGEDSNYCGLYGFTSFNVVRYTENINVKDSTAAMNDAPDLLYILYRYMIVFKGFRHEMEIVTLTGDGKDRTPLIVQAINSGKMSVYPFRAVGETTSTLTDDEHRENIRRGIAHCLRGDVFQVVVSRRFEQRYEGDDFNLYRALRRINPSPYLFYFDFGSFRIFGSSPETHYRVEGDTAYIDPIAGTTRRTGDKATDDALTQALLDNPKENAEHVMLVDLARNDLSRNCSNVKVEFFREPQLYSHVIHLVSRVSGKLEPGTNTIKAFMDTFPAGTLSGAPKVRAMQIISQYEPHNRGAYGGCIGFIGFNGSMNQAITIRTFVSRNSTLWFQAGGGIVAKSDVEQELQEVNNKLGALKAAIVAATDDSDKY
jgi:anthranilate synthase component I